MSRRASWSTAKDPKDSKKDYILEKIDAILEKMQEVQKIDTTKKLIFPDHWIEVQDLKGKLEKTSHISSEQLRTLNYYWAEVLAIEESIKSGKRLAYSEYIVSKVKDIIESDEEDRFQKATYFVKENIVWPTGKLFTLEEASIMVEEVRVKYNIKKPKEPLDANTAHVAQRIRLK